MTNAERDEIKISEIGERNFEISKDHCKSSVVLDITPEVHNSIAEIEKAKRKNNRIRFKTQNLEGEEIEERLNSDKAKEMWKLKELGKQAEEMDKHNSGRAKEIMMTHTYKNTTKEMARIAKDIFGEITHDQKPIDGDYKIK